MFFFMTEILWVCFKDTVVQIDSNNDLIYETFETNKKGEPVSVETTLGYKNPLSKMADIPAPSTSTTLADKSPQPETTLSDHAQETCYCFLITQIQDHKDYNCLS